MKENTEQDWVQRAGQGEPTAIAELFRRYWRAARAASKSGRAVELVDFSLFDFLKKGGTIGDDGVRCTPYMFFIAGRIADYRSIRRRMRAI